MTPRNPRVTLRLVVAICAAAAVSSAVCAVAAVLDRSEPALIASYIAISIGVPVALLGTRLQRPPFRHLSLVLPLLAIGAFAGAQSVADNVNPLTVGLIAGTALATAAIVARGRAGFDVLWWMAMGTLAYCLLLFFYFGMGAPIDAAGSARQRLILGWLAIGFAVGVATHVLLALARWWDERLLPWIAPALLGAIAWFTLMALPTVTNLSAYAHWSLVSTGLLGGVSLGFHSAQSREAARSCLRSVDRGWER